MIRAVFENGDENGIHNLNLNRFLKSAGVEKNERHKILVFRPLGFVVVVVIYLFLITHGLGINANW